MESVLVPKPAQEELAREKAPATEKGRKQDQDAAGEKPINPSEKGRRQEQEAQRATLLEQTFQKHIAGASIDEFATLHHRCCKVVDVLASQDINLAGAAALLADGLLVAAARSLDVTRVAFLQRVLQQALADYHDLISRPLSLPSNNEAEIQLWRSWWPRLAFPIARGGPPGPFKSGLRFCAALTPFAMVPVSDAPVESASKHCPPSGWVPATMRALRAAVTKAADLLKVDKAGNSCSVEGVAYGHPGGLVQTMKIVQDATEAIISNKGEAYGVLIAAADTAWLPEEHLYELKTGEKLTREQLVDIYAEIASGGWVQMIVQPFSEADMSTGCALLYERHPHLHLVTMQPSKTRRSPYPKGEAYSCAFELGGSPALVLEEFIDTAPTWREARGFGRFMILDPANAALLPSALELPCACRDTETLYLNETFSDADLIRISEQAYEMLLRVLYPDDDDEE